MFPELCDAKLSFEKIDNISILLTKLVSTKCSISGFVFSHNTWNQRSCIPKISDIYKKQMLAFVTGSKNYVKYEHLLPVNTDLLSNDLSFSPRFWILFTHTHSFLVDTECHTPVVS